LSHLEAVILALVQGLTEFLPISSSGHLILVPRFLGWDDQGLAFDIAVHLGSLLAVCFYFRDEIVAILQAWMASVSGKGSAYYEGEAKFGWCIVISTIPVCVAGLLWHDFIQTNLRSPLLIASTTLIFGVALWFADRHGDSGKDEHTMRFRWALMIGCAQALALFPGTSRSGITITAALLLGLSRPAAARFSFLMSIPVIALASMNETLELIEMKGPVEWGTMIIGTAVSAVSAYVCIRYFIKLIDKISMLPFAIYRVLLAGVIYFAFVAV
jgi:undecaprenyl-diphosphatase